PEPSTRGSPSKQYRSGALHERRRETARGTKSLQPSAPVAAQFAAGGSTAGTGPGESTIPASGFPVEQAVSAAGRPPSVEAAVPASEPAPGATSPASADLAPPSGPSASSPPVQPHSVTKRIQRMAG